MKYLKNSNFAFDNITILSICIALFLLAWMVIGMIGAFLFLLIQLILIVDFAHAWNEKWVSNHEDSESKCWFAGN